MGEYHEREIKELVEDICKGTKIMVGHENLNRVRREVRA